MGCSIFRAEGSRDVRGLYRIFLLRTHSFMLDLGPRMNETCPRMDGNELYVDVERRRKGLLCKDVDGEEYRKGLSICGMSLYKYDYMATTCLFTPSLTSPFFPFLSFFFRPVVTWAC